jgi:hypothetical protein
MKFQFYPLILQKYSNIKFYENPSSGSRVVTCELTDGRTESQELKKLVVTFYAILPKHVKMKFKSITNVKSKQRKRSGFIWGSQSDTDNRSLLGCPGRFYFHGCLNKGHLRSDMSVPSGYFHNQTFCISINIVNSRKGAAVWVHRLPISLISLNISLKLCTPAG